MLTTACGSREPAPARSPQPADSPPRVFVDAMLIDMHPDDVARLAGKSFDEIAADAGVRVLSGTHVLATDDVTAEIAITRGERLLPLQRALPPQTESDRDEHDFRFEVRPRLVEPDAVHLRVVLELDGRPTHPQHVFSSSAIVRNRHFVPFRTDFPAHGERLVVLLVRPEILRDQEDWRRFLERRRSRLRDAGPFPLHNNLD
ncbi:hypothetical protein [Sorangium atrum]|uniref:Uncharacterized protein n=1 Tax=Sorangium atrum TaxID=2995308 RepID=A0ABT5BUA6_9BACT|nr:hypothetical protein [Sorangium aterium]MDC0677728.1 hypothetical protein [Sorangium aterium]